MTRITRATLPQTAPQTIPEHQEDTMTAVDMTDTPETAGPRAPRLSSGRPLVAPAPGGRPPATGTVGGSPAAVRNTVGRWSSLAAPAGTLPGQAELTRRARDERGREDHRAVRTLVGVIALACVEAEVGRRHLRDLAAWLDLPVYDKVARRIALLERTGARMTTAQPPRPVGARVCEVAPGRVEASASIRCGDRVRAIALRMERRLSRWRVVAVEIG